MPTAIELFKLLPKTNCKDCGQPTCLAFAMLLSNQNKLFLINHKFKETCYLKNFTNGFVHVFYYQLPIIFFKSLLCME